MAELREVKKGSLEWLLISAHRAGEDGLGFDEWRRTFLPDVECAPTCAPHLAMHCSPECEEADRLDRALDAAPGLAKEGPGVYREVGIMPHIDIAPDAKEGDRAVVTTLVNGDEIQMVVEITEKSVDGGATTYQLQPVRDQLAPRRSRPFRDRNTW